jgi:DNA-binding transcriptional LysR family regulator
MLSIIFCQPVTSVTPLVGRNAYGAPQKPAKAAERGTSRRGNVPMRSLNLDQLRTLVEVVELGSFSAAARRLNLTQPAVSLQIRELENRMAARLVERTGKRAYATTAGRELIGHAQGIFEAESRAVAALRRHKDGRLGRVHVGAGPAALAYLLLPVLQRLQAAHPTLELAVTTGNTAEITERMARNDIDLGFTGLPVDRAVFDATVIRDMCMVAIFPESGAGLPDVVTPADLARYPLVATQRRSNHARLARDWLRSAGLDFRPAMEIDNIGVIKRVVAVGFGAAIVPEEAVTLGNAVEGLVHRPLDPPVALTLALIRRRSKPNDAALQIVGDAIMTLTEPAGISRRSSAGRDG